MAEKALISLSRFMNKPNVYISNVLTTAQRDSNEAGYAQRAQLVPQLLFDFHVCLFVCASMQVLGRPEKESMV